MHLDMDAGLAAVLEFVRELQQPIDEAIEAGKPVPPGDFAALSGAVSAMLDAIDARTPQEQPTVKAAA